MKIAFLACAETLPGSTCRRVDAFEHDQQVAALRPPLRDRGANLVELDWRAPLQSFLSFDAVLLGTTWDYQDRRDEFVKRLSDIEAAGVPLFNSAALIGWNIDKTYLRELVDKGALMIPTLWSVSPSQADIENAFDMLNADKLVIKRQVGAGAEGQMLVDRNESEFNPTVLDRPMMIQPFLPAIQEEGEYSFIFIDGVFSHALLKTTASDDYRIQSAYGGQEQAIDPDHEDLMAAQSILSLLPDTNPLYARIDMVRGQEGGLLLMEAELIEPYLYPLQGPEFGERMAEALINRLR